VRHGATINLHVPFLEVHAGEIVAVIGPNGAGKSTLLRVMGLLERPTTGKVFFRATEATPDKALAMRRRMASVFQEPLLLNATLYDNASLGLKLRGLRRDQIDKRLRPWLERLGIAHLESRQARTLSGGEARRTSLARALVLDPELLLFDEPFSALDPMTREALLLDLQAILRETGITTVMVTHDLHEAELLGTRIGVLIQGRLLQLASNREVFARPASDEVAAMVGADNRIPGVVLEVADGMTALRINGGVVKAVGDFKAGARVALCIRPEDISVFRVGEAQKCSVEVNHIKAKVGRISPWMAQYRIVLQSGDERFIALVSKSSFTELCLKEGEDVLASFRPTAVHVIQPRG
jgi:tungstate transport system ATP-binding protein